jgi:AcrR family transcriptional regulator
MHLFATHGFESVSVGDIVRAVGLSERTFFRYFASKEEVLRALPRRFLAAIHKELARQDLDLPILTALRGALRAADKVEGERKSLLRWGRVCSSVPSIGTAAIGGGAYREFLAARLGEVDPRSLRVTALAAAIAAAQSSAFEEWIRLGGRGDLLTLGDDALRGLAEFGAAQLALDKSA